MSVEHELFSFLLVLARVSAFVGFLPLFARRQLPHLVKAGLATALTVFWFGSMPNSLLGDVPLNVVTTTLYLAKELGIGLVLSILVGFMFVPARIAGSYVGQEIGLSLASVSSPGAADSSALVTTIFETFAVLLFFGLNLHHFMISFLHFSLVKVGTHLSLTELPTEMLVEHTANLSEQGMAMIGPISVCLMILTVGLALLNKAAPTLNLFSVGMSLRSGLGLVAMFLFFPVLINAMQIYFRVHQSELESFLARFV